MTDEPAPEPSEADAAEAPGPPEPDAAPAASEPDTEPAGDQPEDGAGGSSGRRRLMIAIAAVTLVLVVAVVVVIAVTRSKPTYDDASQQRFLDACTAQSGDAGRPACQCLYDQIVAQVPYDRFEIVSDGLRSAAASTPTDQPLALPDDLQAMLDDCLAQQTTSTTAADAQTN